MARLVERIEEDAGRRLPPPDGTPPSQGLGRYKDFLKFENQRLRLLHRGGAEGRDVCEARAAMMDVLLRHLLEAVLRSLPADGGGTPPRFALVAIGGYGRGELNPFSDVDLLFLHNLDGAVLARGKVPPRLTALTDGVLYPLWDLGLKVGHAVRSVEDCVKVANADMQSKTALLEARLVAGDAELFERMQSVFLARCVRGFESDYLAARIADQAARRAKHGGSATMQEPNIKNGCGGLRDYQNLLWMSFFKYRTRTLSDLEQRGLISGEERRHLEAAYDFLLRVRNELHHESGRPADVLLRSLQPRIAHNLGYTDRSPVRRLEAFMRELYTHIRRVYLITRTLEQRLALLPDPQQRIPSFRQMIRQGRQRIRRQVVDGFHFVDGEICPSSERVFRDQPRRLLRAFFYAQQRRLRLHPDLAQLVRNQLDLVDDGFRQDPHVRETFLEMLNQRGNVAPALRALHDTGLLGRYLPEFEPLTCRVQHEFYHQYTADEHTLMCVEHLDRIWEAEHPPHRNYTEIFQSLERPFLLYLALLLHDAAKGAGQEDHARAGARLARVVAERLGLDGLQAHSLELVIEHHLLMAQVSQRRDLDDPQVLRHVAAQVQTVENLKMLTLHTVADSLGTSDKLWTGFKDSLLIRLYRRTADLMSDATLFQMAESKQRELLAQEVRRQKDPGIGDDEVTAHFEGLPPRYAQIHTATEVQADLQLVHRFLQRQILGDGHPLHPVVCWQDEPDRGYTTLRVCTWDRPRLFTRLTGALTAAGLNILGAQIFTRTDNVILDLFTVTDARTGLLVNREERDKCERLLERVFTADVDLSDQVARRSALPSPYASVEGERIPTQIRFDAATSERCTVMDVEAEDHVGLLYLITRTLADLGLDIVLARISTEKGAAVDSFYLTERDGGKIVDPARQEALSARLQREIAALAEGPAPRVR